MESKSTGSAEGGTWGETRREHAAATRTTWAEEWIAKFCGFPLAAETVFLRAKYEKGGEKEVDDLLVALREEAIVLSLKHQEDPSRRTGDRLAQWCAKAAKAASRQLDGGVKTIRERPFWCDHAKRGRVDFSPGALHVRHAIACVETAEGIELPLDLPEDVRGTPVTYLSSSDMLNIVKELHSFPDIMDYLDARLTLPQGLRRTIGLEQSLYSYYVVNDQSFEGCRSFADVTAALDMSGGELKRRMAEKHEADWLASVIESISYSMSVPPPDAAVWNTAGDSFQRIEYTKAQEYLCELRLAERRAIGEKFAELRSKVHESPTGLVYSLMYSDGRDFLYVLAVTRGVDREDLVRRANVLLISGLAHRGKSAGMIIVERDGVAYLTILSEGRIDSPEATAAGKEFFANLKTTRTPIRVLPEERYTDP